MVLMILKQYVVMILINIVIAEEDEKTKILASYLRTMSTGAREMAHQLKEV